MTVAWAEGCREPMSPGPGCRALCILASEFLKSGVCDPLWPRPECDPELWESPSSVQQAIRPYFLRTSAVALCKRQV